MELANHVYGFALFGEFIARFQSGGSIRLERIHFVRLFVFKKGFASMDDNGVGVQSLRDANFAGTEHRHKCTLILTVNKKEMSLIEEVLARATTRQYYGVYSIGGVPINARRRTREEIQQNPTINAIKRALGLNFDRTYETDENFGSLRYGRVMLAAGQVGHASRVKGLIINMFHVCWPSLLRREGFLVQMITPVIKVFENGNMVEAFYTREHFNSSVYNIPDELGQSLWDIREYKSLTKFNTDEIYSYFSQLENYCVRFRCESNNQDDIAIKTAFAADGDRKTWIENFLLEALLDVSPLYSLGNLEVTYKDFINREYLLYCNDSLERVIPSVVDGLTRSERKVLYTCLQSHPVQEVTVHQLLRSVNEHSPSVREYAILRMCQNFVGRGNVNLLQPYNGQFGTRMRGGEDYKIDQDMRTKLEDIARLLFRNEDRNAFRTEMGRTVEPNHYLPVIPLILVNGASGFGPGWKTMVPMYHPAAVIRNQLLMLDNRPLEEMNPWFKNFEGIVERLDSNERFQIFGRISVENSNEVRITELPIGSWTDKYKERILMKMQREGKILSYENQSTNTATVNFRVTLPENLPENITEASLCKSFKLVRKLRCAFVGYDEQQNVKTFQNANGVLRYFYTIRLEGYKRRIPGGTSEDARTEQAKGMWKTDLEALLQRPEITHPNVGGLVEAMAELHP